MQWQTRGAVRRYCIVRWCDRQTDATLGPHTLRCDITRLTVYKYKLSFFSVFLLPARNQDYDRRHSRLVGPTHNLRLRCQKNSVYLHVCFDYPVVISCSHIEGNFPSRLIMCVKGNRNYQRSETGDKYSVCFVDFRYTWNGVWPLTTNFNYDTS